jgi:hypothetical protein
MAQYLLVYFRDGAMRLQLPPRASFSKDTMSAFLRRLFVSARKMLFYEQKRMQSGGGVEAALLVKQLTGEFLSAIFIHKHLTLCSLYLSRGPFRSAMLSTRASFDLVAVKAR